MKRLMAAVAVLATLASAAPTTAQSRWSLELNVDAAQPTQKLGGADLDAGFGYGVNGRFRIMPHMAVYGGWEWHHARSDALVAGQKTDVEDTGYTVGLRFEHPLAGTTAWWVRGGGLYSHMELEDASGTLIVDSGHGLGWEAGAGLSLPVSPRVAVAPGVRYRTLTRDLEIGNVTTSSTLSYVTFGMGVVFTF